MLAQHNKSMSYLSFNAYTSAVICPDFFIQYTDVYAENNQIINPSGKFTLRNKYYKQLEGDNSRNSIEQYGLISLLTILRIL